MTTEIATSKTFEEKMRDRVKESIGDLLSNEDLSKIIHKIMEDVFFKEKTIQEGNYSNNYKPKISPPFLHDLIKEQLQPLVNDAIKVFMNDNKEAILKSIDDVVKLGVGSSLLIAINQQFKSNLYAFQGQMNDQLNSILNNR